MVQSVDGLLNLRAVQAFGAGMTVVIVGAMVRDYYSGRQAAQMFALIGIILMVVPLIAPMFGSLLQELGGWRFIFGFWRRIRLFCSSWCLLSCRVRSRRAKSGWTFSD